MTANESPLFYEALLDTAPTSKQRQALEGLIGERVEGLKQLGLDKQPIDKVLAEHAFILWSMEIFREKVEDLLNELNHARQCCLDKERLQESLEEMESKMKFLLEFMHSRGCL